MSNKKGVQVIAPFVAPEGTPVAYVSDIAGAHRVVATKADLTAIPAALLEVGMTAFVTDEGKEYRLETKSETPVTSDWTSAAPSAADIKVAEDKTLADVLITKDEVATKISDAVTAAGETYQTKEDALAAKTALEESIHAVSTAGLSEETKQDIQAAKNAAATITGFQQTLDQTKTELAQKVEEAKQAALTQEDKTAIASIADVKATAEAAKAKAEELEPKITTNKEALDTLTTKVDALPDSAAVDTKISTAKEAINGSIDLVKESVAALKTVVQGSEDGTTKGLDAKLTEAKQEAADNLAAAKQALEHSIEQAATAGLPEETKQDIQAAKQAAAKLTEITSKVEDAVSKATDADTKVGTLETKVTALETFKTDAEPKLAAVDTVKEAVDTLKDTTVPAIDARVTTLEGKAAPTDFTEAQKTKLDEILTGKHYATSEDIDNAKASLKEDLVTSDDANALVNGAVTTAEGKINEAKEALEEKITDLKNTVDGIHVPDVTGLATKEELKGTLKLSQINPILEVKQIKSIGSAGVPEYLVALKIGGVKHFGVSFDDHNIEVENGILHPGLAGYYVMVDAEPITSLAVQVNLDASGETTYTETLTLEASKYVNNDKYIFVAETDDNGNLVSNNITVATKLEDTISDYNFKIDLKASVGTATNIIIGMLASTAGEEFADLAACSTINGQYGQFDKAEFTAIADKLNEYVLLKNGAALTASTGNTLKAIKLKTQLTPDGQNDAYVVTYHRPINHG